MAPCQMAGAACPGLRPGAYPRALLFPVDSPSYWAARHRIPYVVRPLGTLNHWGIRNRRPWLKRASIRWIDGPAVAGAAAVHYASEQEREEASAVVAVRRSVVIPNPVNLDFGPAADGSNWLPAGYPELQGKRTILFLSRLDPTKGLDILLPAFARLRSRLTNVMLVLAGSGEPSFVAGLHDLARELGIENQIVWAGFLEGDAKRAALSSASIAVLPSYSNSASPPRRRSHAACQWCRTGPAFTARWPRRTPAWWFRVQVSRLAEGMAEVLGNGDLRARLSETASPWRRPSR